MKLLFTKHPKIVALFLAVGLLGGSAASAMELPGSEYTFDGSVSVGYDSQYNFRGVNFGENAPWAGIDLNFPLTEALSLNVGTWYINPTADGGLANMNDELDGYAFFNFPLGPVDVKVGGTFFGFLEAGDKSGEFGFSLGYSPGDIVDLGYTYWYDVNAGPAGTSGGSYMEWTVGKSFTLTDVFGLDLGAGVSYGDQYFGVSSFNHAFFTVGVPVTLTETVSMNVYYKQTVALGDLNDIIGENDHAIFGASMSVSF